MFSECERIGCRHGIAAGIAPGIGCTREEQLGRAPPQRCDRDDGRAEFTVRAEDGTTGRRHDRKRAVAIAGHCQGRRGRTAGQGVGGTLRVDGNAGVVDVGGIHRELIEGDLACGMDWKARGIRDRGGGAYPYGCRNGVGQQVALQAGGAYHLQIAGGCGGQGDGDRTLGPGLDCQGGAVEGGLALLGAEAALQRERVGIDVDVVRSDGRDQGR